MTGGAGGPAPSDLGEPPVRLCLPAVPASLPLVRRVVADAAAALGLGQTALDDVKIAVTEACTNVVLHAYGGGRGPLGVEAWAARDRLVVRVHDDGDGLTPRAHRHSPGLGLGLRMIASLADDVSISSQPGRGTDVTMTFLVEVPAGA